ncbi:class F sortase [Candidatus Saccharibacteria bacterium]|nr:class F sortase [Candidatus Saccharibacteria bacterium]
MKKNSKKSKRQNIEPRLDDKSFDSPDLKLNHTKTIVGNIILALILGALALFCIKTAIWEYSYYSEKEGSERAPIINVDPDAVTETIEVDETEVTETQRAEHIVAPDEPRYLSIEKLGIHNARVLSMGLTKDGAIDTPYNIFDAGWYNRSDKPGTGGVMVIDGHNGGPGVAGIFKYLNQLYPGDLIVIERGDGEKFTYQVVENKNVPLAEADQYMSKAFVSPVPGSEAITLISCIGGWNQTYQTYDHRQFTHAVLVK